MANLDPEKYHTLKKENWLIYALVLVILVCGVLFGAYYYYNFAVNRPAQNVDEITFKIEPGQGVKSISEELYRQRLINSPQVFHIYLLLNDLQTSLQAGVYTIPAGTSTAGLAQLFQHGTNDKTVTLLEGWRIEQHALRLSEEFENVDYADFIRLASVQEGYLYPDTYSFRVDVSAKEVFDAMVSNFQAKMISEVDISESPTNEIKNSGLSFEEAVIFASIVEREVRDSNDKPKVAGILIKRWRNGELIGADATTQYAIATRDVTCSSESSEVCPTEEDAKRIDWWPSELTKSDLAYESPYNTRNRVGLPPTPISNPSMATIRAVLNHETGTANYYLTDSDGVTHYADTLDQHNANVAKYL